MERLTHRRTKGPASTPAARVIELQRDLIMLQREHDALRARKNYLEREHDRYHRLTDTSFGGITMAQTWADMWLWEAILNGNPKLKTIFELGTWKGGFSWWLWGQAQVRRMGFHTFDTIPPDAVVPNFQKRDVFAEADALGDWFRALQPAILLCDNGNKPRELRTFAPFLDHPDSLIVVHDWNTEITPDDIPETVEMVYGDFCDQLGSVSRVFRLRRE